MAYTSLLNTSTLSEFTDLIAKEFSHLQQKVTPVAQSLYIVEDLAANTGDTRRYDEVDTETFAKLKNEGDEASKISAGVGLIVAQLKSFLIYGETLAVGNA